MRTILTEEISKERCNAAVFGAYNASVENSEGNSALQIENLVEVNFAHYLRNREKRGAELITQLEKGITSFKERQKTTPLDKSDKLNLISSEMLLVKIKDDFNSYSQRMKDYRRFKKKESKIKKSTKGLPSGLRKAIISQSLNGEI